MRGKEIIMFTEMMMSTGGGGTPKANVEFQYVNWGASADVNFNVPSGIDEVIVVITDYSLRPTNINITGGDAVHLGQNSQYNTGYAVVNIYTVKPTSSQINVKTTTSNQTSWTISFIY